MEIRKSLCVSLFCGAIAFCSAAPSLAQMPPPPPVQLSGMQQTQYAPTVYTAGRMKLFLQAGYGVGFDSIDVGTTTSGDRVSISGGGGGALDLGIGYGLSPMLDLDVEIGGEVSTLTPAVANADGTFTRSYLLATVKRKLPTSDTGQFKVGVGLGAYMNGELDVDARNAGGFHDIIKYKNALGVHLTGEFERFVAPSTSFHVGMKMYFVTYKADSATSNGVPYSADALPGDVKDLNGSGLDFLVGVSQYF